jgi:competence protein ComEC
LKKKIITGIIVFMVILISGHRIYDLELLNQLIYEETENISDVIEVEYQNQGETNSYDTYMEIDFFDCGQGNCSLIQANGETMIIDTGSSFENFDLIDELIEEDIYDIEVCILTHAHEDHIGNFPELCEHIYENDGSIDVVYMPDTEYESQAYEDVINMINRYGIDVKYGYAGQSFVLGDAEVDLFAPIKDYEYEDQNNYSIVSMIRYGDIDFLFPGDAEILSEDQIIEAGYNVDAEVLLQPHHGSRYSGSYYYLEAISPEISIISAGIDNEYNHPHLETIEMLNMLKINTYITYEVGDVEITTDGDTLKINTEY